MYKTLKMISGAMLILMLAVTACVAKATPTAQPTQPPPTQLQPTEPPKTKVTVNFWFAGAEAAVGKEMNTMSAAFTKENPDIEVKFLWETPTEKFLAAGTAGNSPDLYMTYGPQTTGSWATAGAIAPFDEFLKRGDIDVNDILPGLLGSTTWKDKVYGLPYGTDMSMLYYNADMFKAAGLDPEKPPVTMEELLQYAEKLTVVEGGSLKQIGWLPNYGWTHVAGDGSITVRFGATFFNKDGSSGLDDPRWVEVFNWAKWPFDKYGVDNVNRLLSGFGEYGTAQDPICTGKIAMIYDGEWTVLNIKRNCPDLNYRVVRFPYPTAHPDLKDNFEMGGSTIYMPSGAPHKEEAWKFLTYMMKPENIDMFCLASTNGNIPHSIKALKLYDNYKTNLPPDFKYFIDLALTAKPTVIPASSISDEFFSELMKLEEQIYSGKIGVQEGLKNTQDTLIGIFKEKGG